MSDMKETLERARRAAPAPRGGIEELQRRRDRKAMRSKVGTIVFALVLGLGAIGGAFLAFGDGGAPAHRAASGGSAIGGPVVDLTIPADGYYYQRISGMYESWWASDGSGRMTNLGYGREFEKTYGPGELTLDSGPVAYLSTDPVELEAQMRTRVEPGGASPEPYNDWTSSPVPGQEGPITWGLVRSIGELLDEPDVTPAQKAALFQVAAGMDGMQVTPDTTDPDGRPAILLSIETEYTLHEWWFDPQSEQPLALRDTQDGHAPGDATIVQSAGIANSTDSNQLDRRFFADAP
jgi:hypothetical protein